MQEKPKSQKEDLKLLPSKGCEKVVKRRFEEDVVEVFKLTPKKEVKMTIEENCTVVIGQRAWSEIMSITKHFYTEFSGVGMVELVREGDELLFHVGEIYYPKQYNTTGMSEVDQEDHARLITRLVREGVDTSKMRFHWHSHNSMDVFHSGTDENNYEDMDNQEWSVSLVVNKKMEFLARIDFYKPLRVVYTNIPVHVKMESVDKEWVEGRIAVAKEADLPNRPGVKYSGYDWRKEDEKWNKNGEKHKSGKRIFINGGKGSTLAQKYSQLRKRMVNNGSCEWNEDLREFLDEEDMVVQWADVPEEAWHDYRYGGDGAMYD